MVPDWLVHVHEREALEVYVCWSCLRKKTANEKYSLWSKGLKQDTLYYVKIYKNVYLLSYISGIKDVSHLLQEEEREDWPEAKKERRRGK